MCISNYILPGLHYNYYYTNTKFYLVLHYYFNLLLLLLFYSLNISIGIALY